MDLSRCFPVLVNLSMILTGVQSGLDSIHDTGFTIQLDLNKLLLDYTVPHLRCIFSLS